MLFNGIDLTPYLHIKRITGRGLMNAEVDMKTASGKDGAYYQRRRRPPRPLGIEADVKANDEFELRTKLDELNGILDVSEPVPIVFPDEPNITYYGVPQASGEGDEYTFLHRGQINIICPDPDKIGKIKKNVINMIPTFSIWRLNTPENWTVVDDYEMHFEQVGSYDGLASIEIAVEGGKTYTFSADAIPSIGYYYAFQYDKDGNNLTKNYASIFNTMNDNLSTGRYVKTFTLHQDAVKISLLLEPKTSAQGNTFIAKNPMLNEGTNSVFIPPGEEDMTFVNEGTRPAYPIIKAVFKDKFKATDDFNSYGNYDGVYEPVLRTGALKDTYYTDPSKFNWGQSTSSIDKLKALDSDVFTDYEETIGYHANAMFGFDLIRFFEKSLNYIIPGDTTAAKVAWIKATIPKLTANLWVNAKLTNPDKMVSNFLNKITASFTENPHKAQYLSHPDLKTPTEYAALSSGEFTTSEYQTASVSGESFGTVDISARQQNYVSQQYFKFDLIKQFEKTNNFVIPGANAFEKANWLINKMAKLEIRWRGSATNGGGYYDKRLDAITRANYAGKVAASTVENPHSMYLQSSTTLWAPSSYGGEGSTYAYGLIDALDNSIMSYGSTLANGEIAQTLFSFDLIAHIERTYDGGVFTIPGATIAEKVIWLKANVTRLTANWWGKGSGPSGNKATIKMWRVDTSIWDDNTIATHALGVVSKLVSGSTSPNIRVDSNGFVHFLAYADASDGTTASRIETDFIELEVELNIEHRARVSVWNNDSWLLQSSTVNENVHDADLIVKESYFSDWVDDEGYLHVLAHSLPGNEFLYTEVLTDYIEVSLTFSEMEKVWFKTYNYTLGRWSNGVSVDDATVQKQLTQIIDSAELQQVISPSGYIYLLTHGDTVINGEGAIYANYVNISMELDQFASDFTVSNEEGKFVKVIRDFQAYDILEIDFKKRKVMINGKVAMTALSWEDSEFFTLPPKGESTIYVNPDGAASIEVKFEERWS